MASILFDDQSDSQPDNHYPKLSPNSAQIRLIVLAPGELDSPIHCTYRVVDLDDEHTSYENLSYVWNDGAGTVSILVDGHAATVGRSLFGALEQLRQVDTERTMWIDAICINQSCNTEKTQQVGMMCNIYKQCTQCIIWMGPLGETSLQDATLAMDMVKWMAKRTADPPEFLHDASQRRRAAEALNTFTTRPWWGRMWTIQEAKLPRRCFIYWGPCRLPWDHVDRASKAIMDSDEAPKDLGNYHHEFFASGAFDNLPASMEGLRASDDEPALFLFWRWRIRQATDPRDKIYALMGLRGDLDLPNVPKPDYSLDVAPLFTRVTADLINQCRDLNPLIGRRGETPALKGLPSWVVDWSGHEEGQERADFWIHEARWFNRGYCADRGIFGVGDGLRFADESDKRVLLLSGLYVDKIAVVEQRPTGSRRSGEEFHEVLLGGADRWADLIKRFQGSGAATGQAVELPDGWMQAFLGLIMGRLVPADPDDGDPDDWAREMVRDQAIFITEGGRFGLGPVNAQVGQQLWIVGGCRLPVILDGARPPHYKGKDWDETGRRDFTWVSDCFVYCMMKGEAVEGRGNEQVDFNLH
ncbi:hypothetical protein Daus18300_013858 [Diaporthe australafricana]|uniref:Heterokaryon incompatibility domain-containing protein n=1 Tax=Diaporthe australafricana TaxID=127596 RepID=A0ABR3VXG9_9PEZI